VVKRLDEDMMHAHHHIMNIHHVTTVGCFSP